MGLSHYLGEYSIVKTIGQGAFSKVKLAIHRESNKKVAIKIVDKEIMKKMV
jgi:serine/threonine protein kinase